jgi:predicted MFS family arabinose efflux permease
LTDAISYVCSVLSIFLMRARFQEERTEEPRNIWREIGEGLLWLWGEHVLRFLALLTLVLVFSTVGFTLILIVLAQNLHATPLAIGMLFASGGVGSIAGAVLSGPLQKRFAFGPLTIGSAFQARRSRSTTSVRSNGRWYTCSHQAQNCARSERIARWVARALPAAVKDAI